MTHQIFLEDIQQIEEERNFYFKKLSLIEQECVHHAQRKTSGGVPKPTTLNYNLGK